MSHTVKDRTFTWTTEDGATVTIPLRLKLGVVRQMADRDMDAATMFDLLDRIAPDQGDVLDEMDLNDFEAMFRTWQDEYRKLSGASLPESSASQT